MHIKVLHRRASCEDRPPAPSAASAAHGHAPLIPVHTDTRVSLWGTLLLRPPPEPPFGPGGQSEHTQEHTTKVSPPALYRKHLPTPSSHTHLPRGLARPQLRTTHFSRCILHWAFLVSNRPHLLILHTHTKHQISGELPCTSAAKVPTRHTAPAARGHGALQSE